MHFKEIKKTATCTWSPNAQQSPLLAVGTVSGAMDDSFSSDAHLEIYDLNVQSGASNVASVVASILVPSRYFFQYIIQIQSFGLVPIFGCSSFI